MCLVVDVDETRKLQRGKCPVVGIKSVLLDAVVFDQKGRVIHIEGRSSVRNTFFGGKEIRPSPVMTLARRKKIVKPFARIYGGAIHFDRNELTRPRYDYYSHTIEVPVSTERRDIIGANEFDIASAKVKILYGPKLTRHVKAWLKATKYRNGHLVWNTAKTILTRKAVS